jgi:hypothetical protein
LFLKSCCALPESMAAAVAVADDTIAAIPIQLSLLSQLMIRKKRGKGTL